MTPSSADSSPVRCATIGSRPSSEKAARIWEVICFWLLGSALAALTWGPLGFDAARGLHGGDIYSYFFPLKAWYADRLQLGELPLWNPMIGHGFPALGESQTGIFYPPNLVFYRCLPLNAAYHANFLLHYVLAFGFTCHYARRLGLSMLQAVLCSVVFVYGWFPARSCLEWAIITGAWIPLAFWGVERFAAKGCRRSLGATQLAILMQLLAGHFNFAFVTLFGLALYVPLRIGILAGAWRLVARCAVQLAIAISLAFAVSAMQLVPSWELKNRSQRASAGFGAMQVGYGAVPSRYLAQTITPWNFYPRAADPAFEQHEFGDQNTNRVEAHLYFGLIPLCLAVVAVVAAATRKAFGASRGLDRLVAVWFFLGCVSLTFTIGIWTRYLAHLPGFGYFTGPGRYGVLVQLGVGILAAAGANEICEWIASHVLRHAKITSWMCAIASVACIALVEFWMSWSGGGESFLETLFPIRAGWCSIRQLELGLLVAWLAALVVTTALQKPVALFLSVGTVLSWIDLVMAALFVQFAVVRPDSPIDRRESSTVRLLLEHRQPPARVLARNQNAISLCGVATVPVYLGIGPREYFGGPLQLPDDFHWGSDLTPRTIRWLRWAGVTHILSFDAMHDDSLQFVWKGIDPMLHPLLGRATDQPLWLYEIIGSRDRCYRVSLDDEADALDEKTAHSIEFQLVPQLSQSANRVSIAVDCDRPSFVVLTELHYPGWNVEIDGQSAEPVSGTVFRAVRVPAGPHEIVWSYRPTSLLIGLIVSGLGMVGTGVFYWSEVRRRSAAGK